MQLMKMFVLFLLLSTNLVDARGPLHRSKAKARQLKANAHAKNECRYNRPSREICVQTYSKLKTIEEQQNSQDVMLILPIFIIGMISLIRSI